MNFDYLGIVINRYFLTLRADKRNKSELLETFSKILGGLESNVICAIVDIRLSFMSLLCTLNRAKDILRLE